VKKWIVSDVHLHPHSFLPDIYNKIQFQWVVKEKVTAYGQNLILFCPVDNCCNESTGWSVGPMSIIQIMQETLFNETVGQEEGWISWVNISFDYSSIVFCIEGNIKLKYNIPLYSNQCNTSNVL
jgi:hypothetical protein